ncbi:hypothetical protein HHI36_019742 [Cryptolaemus montrouzieri]|uniref:Aldehyde oxidase/xanthine dehydrogenase first molybdopterin binding domain-containing protein n=1 Tax=Cryptolaemus montrouzieri TaxID=559131 RepID=A0ABD2N8M0_9CUCU
MFKERELRPKRTGTDLKHKVSGTFDLHSQYHFHMETQCCLVVPTEDGIDMFPSTQWMDLNQASAAKMLNIPQNKN